MRTLSLLFLLGFLTLNAYANPQRHFCRPNQTDLSCKYELALVCGDGYIDGCLVRRTSVHKCVLKNEGPSCKLEIQILCVDHFMDGCENGQTTRHQCVPIEGGSCERDMDFVCPTGFHDVCDL